MSSGQKMSAQQKILLLEWLEKPQNRWAQTTHINENTQAKVIQKWEEVTTILNGCRFGGKKVPVKWRETFKQMRSHIKKKNRLNIAQKRVGHKHAIPLSAVDVRYLRLFQSAVEDEFSDVEGVVTSPAEGEKAPDATASSPKVDAVSSEARDCPLEAEETSPKLRERSPVTKVRSTEEAWVKQDMKDKVAPKLEKEVSWPDSDEDKYSKQLSAKRRKVRKKKTTECTGIKKEIASFQSIHSEDEAEVVAQGWAVKLRRLSPQQRLLAEKFINDIIFEAEMGSLHRDAIAFHLHDRSSHLS